MAVRYKLATTFWTRLRGLIGRKGPWLPAGCELIIVRCGSVHTFFMRQSIDVAFAGKDGRVLRVERGVRPRRLLRCPGASMTIERFAVGGTWYREGSGIPFSVL